MLDANQFNVAGARLAALEQQRVLLLDPGPDDEDKFSKVLCEVLDDLVSVSDGKLRV